jgi:cobaltochelatase CobS
MRSIKKGNSQNSNDLTQDMFPNGQAVVNIDQKLNTEIFGSRMIKVPFYDKDCKYLMKPLENYVFNDDVLRAIICFLDEPFGDALYLQGPSGCGKTSILTQVCALLGWPLLQVTLNGHFEVSQLIGHPSVVNDELVFVHGPLARAMKYGYFLVLNEIDLAEPSELAGLNDVLEGRNLVIVQNNGEIIEPDPNFRVAVTANTRGSGDYRKFSGTQMLNSAFLDRFRFITCDYISDEAEEKLLKQATPYLDHKIHKMMVRVASEVREAHLSTSPTHIHMTVPMSTRVLLRWGRLIKAYQLCVDPVHLALKHAFTGRLTIEEACFVHRLCSDGLRENSIIFKS